MKKWRQIFQSLFFRHIAGPEPVGAAPAKEPTADLEMIRFSVWQHLRSARKHQQVLLSYSAVYATIIDELRMEGYVVQLYAGADGALAYVISARLSDMLS